MADPTFEKPPEYAPGYQPPFQQPGYGTPNMNPGYPPPPQAGYSGMPPPGGPQYGSPGQTYPPPQGLQQGTTIIVGAPTVTVVSGFHEGPMNVTCPQCRLTVLTKTSYETGTLTWLICGILVLLGCWLGCCVIPFCVNGCKDVRHTCPNCNTCVGVYRRI